MAARCRESICDISTDRGAGEIECELLEVKRRHEMGCGAVKGIV